jgi:hypothetical protein
MTTTNQSPPSIHAIPLATTGAIPAREGFNLQDHVAASYCIRMISDSQIKEVWSEVQDDVTLIWQAGASEEVEYVQVKGSELDQLWSLALLCQQESGGHGTSIFERSLSRDSCSESCRFRIVTAEGVKEELRPLIHQLDSPERLGAKAELDALAAKLIQKIKSAQSPNGSDGVFWVSRMVWQVVHAVAAVQAQNLVDLEKQLERNGYLLLADQRQELYQKLVRKVWDAAVSKIAAEKKIKRHELLVWLSKTVALLAHPSSSGGQRMTEKMQAANLPPDAIMAAHEARNRYRLQALMEQYSGPTKHLVVEAEIVATLSTLRARLDAGEYADDGPSFYSRCLDSLQGLHDASAEAKQLGLAYLHGCMYNIMDRCGHRFRRVTQ